MNNPLSSDQYHALYPAPEGCTGWRLWRMLYEAAQAEGGAGVLRSSYALVLDRRNVLPGREWDARTARRYGAVLVDELHGRRVVLVGVSVLQALGLTRPGDWCRWVEEAGLTYTLVPHASGRCREYNDPAMRERVGRLLLGEYRRSVGL